jgi:hypothetical protein
MNKLFSYTQNGATTLTSSGSKVLDLFGSIGALRKAKNEDITSRFESAFSEDKLLTLKTLFYARDVRGGQGERRVFRVILSYLANKYPEVAKQILSLVAEYGRWDDLLELALTPLEKDAFSLIQEQFTKDIASLGEGEPVSLLGKWLPSENASNKARIAVARRLIHFLDIAPKTYRTFLSAFRREIQVVEREMCSKEWDKIDYSKIPGRAGLIHRKAFLKNDEVRYRSFLGEVTSGKVKLKTKVLYPYDIIAPILPSVGFHQLRRVGEKLFPVTKDISKDEEATLTAYWNNLPNYLGENEREMLVVVDTSGSMRGLPVQVAVSLGLYIAERNKGAFKDYFLSFSRKPQLQKVKGDTLAQKVSNIVATDWDENTDLEAVFNLLLNTAKLNKLKAEDMPKQILIISDMEFDRAVSTPKDGTFLDGIKKRYAEFGYEMPSVAFWNVNARSLQSPVQKNDKGMLLVSGCSPAILTEVLSGTTKTAYELMLEKLNSPRYEKIVVK